MDGAGLVSNLSRAYDIFRPREESGVHIHFKLRGGERGELLREGMGLPEAISGHNNYYIWGPGSCTGQVLITIGDIAFDRSAGLQERDHPDDHRLPVLHSL